MSEIPLTGRKVLNWIACIYAHMHWLNGGTHESSHIILHKIILIISLFNKALSSIAGICIFVIPLCLLLLFCLFLAPFSSFPWTLLRLMCVSAWVCVSESVCVCVPARMCKCARVARTSLPSCDTACSFSSHSTKDFAYTHTFPPAK